MDNFGVFSAAMYGMFGTVSSILLLIFIVTAAADGCVRSLTSIRGGLVPQATEDGEYYEKFKIDYGCDDNRRTAGSLRGLIREGALSSLPRQDRFLRWFYDKLEKGPQSPASRVKPFYAADFGTKSDLKRNENPVCPIGSFRAIVMRDLPRPVKQRVVILNRRLEWDDKGQLKSQPSSDKDVEVREIWQPWLKQKCDFVVRYIVPNRANIIEIMEGQGRFRAELEVGTTKDGTQKTATARMVFRPTLLDRLLRGKKDVVITHPIAEAANKLFTRTAVWSHIASQFT